MAPAARSARAASARVAPVVSTSSTMMQARPSTAQATARPGPHGSADAPGALPPAQSLLSAGQVAGPCGAVPQPARQGQAGGIRLRARGTVFRSASATVNPGIASPRTSRRSRTWTGLKPRLRYAAALWARGRGRVPAPGPAAAWRARARPRASSARQPGLPVAFEGQQALRQLGPVCPGRHHGQQHGAVHVHQGRSLGLCPERPARQQAQLREHAPQSAKSSAPQQTQSTGMRQGEHLSRRLGCPVAQPRQRPRVARRGGAPPWPRPGQGQGPLPGPGCVWLPILRSWTGCAPGSSPAARYVDNTLAGTFRGTFTGSGSRRPAAAPRGAGQPASEGCQQALARGASQPGNEGSMGPLSCGDQPLPSRWKIPSADWP